jgi:molecular chaperone DnaK (HSP70)
MVAFDKRYIVGIDLGTTNSAVSYADIQSVLDTKTQISSNHPFIKIFRTPQLTGPGEVTRMPVLPSFLYIPGEFEISKDNITLPWATSEDYFSGAFARDHGAKVPSRLVSSAKSWLCHANVDRHARILPWGGKLTEKVSPVQATAAYLNHIRKAWNHAHDDDAELSLENQLVVVTVPASFDEVARDLTVEACTIAGLRNITLLEEPLAAFYSWLIRHENSWQDYVSPNELILVCDVGGGTTDFTLITLKETDGSPRFERLAVGDHLILGGDNIDLTLARGLESQFSKKNVALTGDRWKTLCHECRQAKETILGHKAEKVTVTLMGEGSRLIAGTVSADLTRTDVEAGILDGFFPLIDAQKTKTPPRKGITEFGLPYEPEPAITRHLGEFLTIHESEISHQLGKDSAAPDLILFNGGTLKPDIIQDQIRKAIRHWFHEADDTLPRVLDNPDPDLAVSLGAAYYGLVKSGVGVRVGSGSPRAYYLGISKKSSTESTAENEAICLVERGLDEGSDIELKEQNFQVLTNQPVQFDVYSSSFRSGDRCGDIVSVDDSFSQLPTLQTIIEFGKKGQHTEIPVRLEARYTEMGTLSLWCRSLSSPHRWQLQFQLRDAGSPTVVSDQKVLESSVVEDAIQLVQSAFKSKSNNQAIASLAKQIVNVTGQKKEQWPLSFIRQLSDALLESVDDRKQGPAIESRWLNLTGFCMRPGLGDGFDVHRIKRLWKIYRPGPHFPKNAQVRSEWWIFWRRLAGGMSPGYQRQISQDLSSMLFLKKGDKQKTPEQERVEMWMLIANMEQLHPKDKIRWGRQLLSEVTSSPKRSQLFWALSRIGARELLYAPADRVIPPNEVYAWCNTLMGLKTKHTLSIGKAIAQLCRKTGDRVRDLSQEELITVGEWMTDFNGLETYRHLLEEIVPLAAQEESDIFGESLPSGLVLHE